MKTLGLIGGTSWVSTVDYYKHINLGINEKLGGLEFSQCMLYSFNFADIKRNNDADDWDSTYEMVLKACCHLENAGVVAIVLCANTLHYLADRLTPVLSIPIIHVGEATAKTIEFQKIKKVGLLGTKFTMELDFIKSKLTERGIETIIPNSEERDFIHASIFDELGKNIILPETKKRYLQIINNLITQGASGIILGCTEIPLLIQQSDCIVPVFDTLILHAQAAVDFQLS